MKSLLSRLGWVLPLLAVVLPATTALAQDSDMAPTKPPLALAGAFLAVMLIFCLAAYIYVALALQTIAKKTNTENAWLAWIPIVNIVLMLAIAKKPVWWIILFLIPLVNIVISIIVWMAVAEARGKPNWWGILIIVPLVGVIVPGYLAWSD